MKYEYIHDEITVNYELVKPDSRMICVSVFVYRVDDGGWSKEWDISPVVALQISTVHNYYRPDMGEDYPALVPDVAMNLQNGWSFDSQEIDHDAIVISREFGLWTATLAFPYQNQKYEFLACNWPQSEDDQHVGETIARLKEKVIDILKSIGSQNDDVRPPVPAAARA